MAVKVLNDVKNYLQSDVTSPFFLVVGDSEYFVAKEQLSALGLEIVGLSRYCNSPDRVPNFDNLFEDFKNGKNKALVGLGEYLALNGETTAFDMLSKLQDFNLNGRKVVLLLRCVADIVKKLQKNDLRFNRRCVAYGVDCSTNLALTCITASFELPSAHNGLKGLLEAFENSNKTKFVAKIKREFINPLIEVYNIAAAYDGVRHLLPTFRLPSEYGTEDNWKELLTALTTTNGSLDIVFDNCGFSEDLLEDFDTFIQGISYKNWLYFIALKIKSSEISNSYLQYVLEITEKFDYFKNNILTAIIDIPHTDKRFDRFYKERKELIAKFNEADIAAFVRDNKMNPADGLYRLTDQTQTEREELIVLFGLLDKKTVLNRVETVYATLYEYLYSYSFSDPKMSDDLCKLLTDYFDRYKWQKVLNNFKNGFVDYVETLANERKYNELQSRNEIINNINKTDTKLYWLDALGVEFLGLIQIACKRLGLALKIHIGRAELPTMTFNNRDFYDKWQNNKEHDTSLDEIKHKKKGGYNYEENKLPIHLARELDVIDIVLNKIAVDLHKHNFAKILLASDHGASRLAVIKEQEEKYDTDTKGEHGGRCCKTFPDYDLPFAAEEDGYLVLANYGRFKGSRKANVEVHGGASLEEVVVPIIEITLAHPNIKIQLLNETVYADYKTCAEFIIFSNIKLNNVKVIIDGKPYIAIKTSDTHYKVITDIKRAGTYHADVFDGDSLIGKITFTAHGKNRSNSDFDF